ncbi:SOS response-associated peptidase family protein [Rathayibacter sp. Leaf296]|uniref:SOS response-associated peptidase family protein n=1 Tax=Rathayibacter sp. Leaf296 TaxID=1736327 RepID=UPI000702AA55|nr:SOS response-associated peptidase family protein [Rathayibacter sp. Leaf296]KQQ10015.1 hypothetical protein ASF46_02610 [Rathayibacter sp. Leaf296]
MGGTLTTSRSASLSVLSAAALHLAEVPADARSSVAPGEVHDRMPACITPDGYDDWLGGHLDVDALMQLLDRESYAVEHDLEHYEVSGDVNNVRTNGPHLLDPLPVSSLEN